ncbi:archaetidylserine decarboxylase [Sphingomonas sp. BIUV-7]|uniref:phosphatidylserine decarboxylase n=1 Tax=Sphingomonas natans TaxID=3063330 RepID=A0ABT8YEL0_9SPHN|nr:archaetidylserine decarboxylase [Sphingomonas sp. BIUV-7]MDO6416777.1 archaetidylserine decarboxylase [Sphingomonas sp. BIUV-7]
MRVLLQEDVNFLLTNRLPRRLATQLVGRFSRIEQPLVAKASIRVWRIFSDLDLSDAAAPRFASLHDCFTRRLRPGARPVDPRPDILASPCDAIVGAHGTVTGDEIHQIKGMPYSLAELLGDAADGAPFAGGTYVTLRLTAAMYHHFHAPHDLAVERVRYLSGDCWNVNPIALKRVERLFCRNERAIVSCRLADDTPFLIVAVAAILVAGIRLTFLDTDRLLRDGGPRTVPVSADIAKGDEMGWFEHGSTLVLLLPPGFALADGIAEGTPIRQGEALARRLIPNG